MPQIYVDVFNFAGDMNAKTLQEVLCSYEGIETDNGPGALDDKTIRSIAKQLDGIPDKYALEIISANWGAVCFVKALNVGEIKVTFDGSAIDDITFKLIF